MDTIYHIAIINSLKTGNVLIDLFIFLIIGILFSKSVLIKKMYDSMCNYFTDPYKGIYRKIEYSERMTNNGYYIGGTDQTKNKVLQRAIMLYLSQLNKKYKTAIVLYNTTVRSEVRRSDETTAIDNYCLSLAPIEDEWTFILDDLEFKYTNIQESTGNKDDSVHTSYYKIELRTLNDNGAQYIDIFLNNAQKFYKELITPKETSRFMYISSYSDHVVIDKEKEKNDSNTKCAIYKRYKLSDRKTFDSLFFDNKKEIIALINNFTNKTDKYSIEGYPNKLGFLLHGPPGCGKTTFIKALAHYTKRHIITVSLSKIKTNQELFDIMFDLSFKVTGQDFQTVFSFKDVIFIMEDIDAASNVVFQRKNETDIQIENDTVSDTNEDIIGPVDSKNLLKNIMKMSICTDKLNLAGLLNVLDGVIDTEDRIVIMTSNFPDKIDTALIRPGRIDKIIELSYIKKDNIKNMLELYYPNQFIDSSKLDIIEDKKITPASLEQRCSEYTLVDDLIVSFYS
jgi:chaperone BCS1